MATTDGESLSDEQLHALVDILSHHELFQELRDLNAPNALSRFGPPYTKEPGQPSEFPALQTLSLIHI